MIQEEKTSIAAIASSGTISIIRLSGPDAYQIALKLTKQKSLKIREAKLAQIYEQDTFLDEAIVIYFKAPHSFSGEDTVEIQCHGGAIVAKTILQTILDTDLCRLANPGEFSKRSFLNGKMDLSKAEAISQLIESKSKDSMMLLSRHLKGDLQTFCDEIRSDLIEIVAYIEVSIDYAEEDLPQDILDNIFAKLQSAKSKLKHIYELSQRRNGLLKGFSISIVGKPNVGKSSLLNKLLAYNRAIVSNIEGTTRDTIEEELYIGSHLVKIIDTAGIRDAKDDIEKQGILRSKDAIKNSDIVIAIFDNSREIDQNDKDIIKLIQKYENDKKVFTYINKKDLKNRLEETQIPKYKLISTKDDVQTIVDDIEEFLNTKNIDELMLTSQRQLELVSKATLSLQEADIDELELFSFNINEAIKQIAHITKSYENDDMLDIMFGSFCLGK